MWESNEWMITTTCCHSVQHEEGWVPGCGPETMMGTGDDVGRMLDIRLTPRPRSCALDFQGRLLSNVVSCDSLA